MEELEEGMGDCRAKVTRVKLLREGIEWFWVLAEVGDVKDRLGVWEVETREIGIESCFGRTKVGDSCACGDSSTCLQVDQQRGQTVQTVFSYHKHDALCLA